MSFDFESFRREREREQAQHLADGHKAIPPTTPDSSFAERALSDRQVAHRRAMLAHLNQATAAK